MARGEEFEADTAGDHRLAGVRLRNHRQQRLVVLDLAVLHRGHREGLRLSSPSDSASFVTVTMKVFGSPAAPVQVCW